MPRPQTLIEADHSLPFPSLPLPPAPAALCTLRSCRTTLHPQSPPVLVAEVLPGILRTTRAGPVSLEVGERVRAHCE